MDEKKFQACLSCLTQFKQKIARLSYPIRKHAALELELFTLLQFLTIEKERTIFEASRSDINEWLKPAIGFSDYAVRIEMLNFISEFVPKLEFDQHHHPLTLKILQLVDFIFWGRRHRRLESQTRDFFQSITQQQIIDSEIRCVPFYKAMHAVTPDRDTSGSFSECDEEIVKLIRALNPKAAPHITDLGCGGGRLLKRLAREFPDAKLSGTSIFTFSDEELKELGESGINPVYCTANYTGLPDQSQDIVVSTVVIEHLREPKDMIREIKRILKPGGIYCVTAPSVSGNMLCRNPLSYLAVLLSIIFPFILPPFHNLYSPLTPIRIVHYGFHPSQFRKLFGKYFNQLEVLTSGFIALKKFRLDQVAPKTQLLKDMGSLCIALGKKD